MRERTIVLTRVKNEERWIGRMLRSAWKVADRVVLFDDSSEDRTIDESLKALGDHASRATPVGIEAWSDISSLQIIFSPFAGQHLNEYRDKQFLWESIVGQDWDFALCLDGDEYLSQWAIGKFYQLWEHLGDVAGVASFPFITLWDSEGLRRVDDPYGMQRHDRFISLVGVQPGDRHRIRFVDSGNPAGFHVGWIPKGRLPSQKFLAVDFPIVHLGYVDPEVRQRKLEFYTAVDPQGEDGYRHIIGEPNAIARGPVQLVPWFDQALPEDDDVVSTRVRRASGPKRRVRVRPLPVGTVGEERTAS